MKRMRMKMNVIYKIILACAQHFQVDFNTFMPYCSLAIIGLSEMNVKSLRRHVNGRGMMRARKMSISVTKRRNTCKKSKSKHVSNMMRHRDVHEGGGS
jgi:hypothetical protein